MPYANSFVFLMCFSGPRMNNSCSSSERTQRAQPIGVSTGQGNNSRPLRVLPDFAQVYRFIGSVFDPKATGHLQKLKKMDPIDVETVLPLMRNLYVNLASPDFEDHRRLLSSFFGIFDGHGGSKAAEFVAHNLENWSLNFVYDVLQGGYVDFCRGVWRKQGSPVVSRGIGDRYLKQWVKAEPKTEVFSIEPEHDLSILACNIAQPLVACKKLLDLSVS